MSWYNGRFPNLAPSQRGISYLELMIAVALLALLVAIAIPSYGNYKKRMAIQTAITDIRRIEQMLARYELQSVQGTFPNSLDQIGVNMTDPWGNPYQYLAASSATIGQLRKDRGLVPVNTDYDLYSNGPDGSTVSPLTSALSRDDIVRAGNGGFVGIASDYVP